MGAVLRGDGHQLNSQAVLRPRYRIADEAPVRVRRVAGSLQRRPSAINWQFTAKDDRTKLKSLYPDFETYRAGKDELGKGRIEKLAAKVAT